LSIVFLYGKAPKSYVDLATLGYAIVVLIANAFGASPHLREKISHMQCCDGENSAEFFDICRVEY